MNNRWIVLVALCWISSFSSIHAQPAPSAGKLAAKPLFRDAVYDGAADPVLIYNRAEKKWFMFYTNRRANVVQTTGVTWVHGTDIGIAESSDGGATWSYRGVADIDVPPKDGHTYWAPDVFEHQGVYHMMLTVVPGIFDDWNHPRNIFHLTSTDLLHWKSVPAPTKLSTDRAIDATVFRLPDGGWRMWYNNERAGKSTFYADSKDLIAWEDKGSAKLPSDRGEGPKVFRWKDKYWMVIDTWRGIGIYHSDDLTNWKLQEKHILEFPGKGPEDGTNGGHPDVQVSGDRAWIFYFIHPGRSGTISTTQPSQYENRRSLIQVAELKLDPATMTISADRDAPTYVDLKPPAER